MRGAGPSYFISFPVLLLIRNIGQTGTLRRPLRDLRLMENIKQHLSRGSTLPHPNVNVGYRIIFLIASVCKNARVTATLILGGAGGAGCCLIFSRNSEEMHWGYHDMHGCHVRS